MAKQDAAEQAKEFLRQVIRYRFWISISVAALFAVIAYLVGSGPIRTSADTERKKIKDAEKEVELYRSPTIPTKDYMPIVDGKTKVLDQDVNSAWRTLFDRQAPLLTWPSTVQERFRAWGPKWPEKVNPRQVELAIVDYIEAYPAYVTMVYETCNPFNYESGKGIVTTSGQDELLRPTKFDVEHPPDLGKVWAAQERLWIQRTLMEVVAEVNKNAKTWDEATIRQIVELDVGNPTAQDQRSLAKNEQLLEAEGIYAPGETPPADGGTGAAAGVTASSPGGKGGLMGNLSGGAMGGLGGAAASENVFYVKSDSDKYKVMPILMSVLIDQDHLQDFLIELENSPMWIQVKDFELQRPTTRVVKPEKGEESGAGLMGMMGSMRQMAGMGGMGGMTGMGGQAQMQQQAQMAARMQQQMMSSMSSMADMSRGGGMGGAAPEQKKGKSTKGVDFAKEREKKEKAAAEAQGPKFFDPYFNIVLVRVYGQARFFKPPPEAPAVEPSPGDVAGAPAASGATGAAAKDAAKTAPAASQPATAGPVEKPAQAPDAAPKADAAPKSAAEPADKQASRADKEAAPKAAEKGEPALKTPKDDAAAKTQPEDAKPKP
jgi:hypothetical protein